MLPPETQPSDLGPIFLPLKTILDKVISIRTPVKQPLGDILQPPNFHIITSGRLCVTITPTVLFERRIIQSLCFPTVTTEPHGNKYMDTLHVLRIQDLQLLRINYDSKV